MRILPSSSIAIVLCAGALLTGCGPAEAELALRFEGRVGERPFACGATYDGFGASGATYTALDFRFYVHDVRLVTEAGEEIQLALIADGAWQTDEVALLDFEDGAGCPSGSAPTRFVVRGRVPAATGAITAVRFRMGVPEHLNHVNAAAQPAPMNVSSLFWGWAAGYDYLRIDGRTESLPFSTFLLGATACTGDARMGTRVCARGNRAEIEVALEGGPVELGALEDGAIVADLAELFATTDVAADAGGAVGCMSEPTDPECATLFPALGLGLDGATGGAQRFFRFEAGGATEAP